MAKDLLTDEAIELEIERLKNSEAVKLAQAEQKFKYRRRQYVYTLRWYEKRGYQLMKQGVTIEDFKNDPNEEGEFYGRCEAGANHSQD